ncbi:hypothetical protein HMPREF9123_1761 [Neisseria bacilliformis ATCC BAA-1200]|uniref:Uncharacterized protein n=1 Tax=Neisseria bacilliformis ATCC BAA-1200 TaxID=888742 RepID=F2BDF5_9NEIS|nr:hypothetical protein HMPREF9123_1761 [Neisseria bacilliformis ATCC BAA-1200]
MIHGGCVRFCQQGFRLPERSSETVAASIPSPAGRRSDSRIRRSGSGAGVFPCGKNVGYEYPTYGFQTAFATFTPSFPRRRESCLVRGNM